MNDEPASRSSQPQTLTLDDPRCSASGVAGGKGAGLAALTAAGFPVPPGFVVTTAGFASCLETCTPKGRRLHALTARERRALLVDGQLPAGLAAEILEAEALLAARLEGPAVYAVRSSATGEDGAAASFAGQHETYYYVTRDNLLDMIRHCWLSLYAEHAVSYRATQGIDENEVAMAVVVQLMIAADSAGVSFSIDPTGVRADCVVTEACWGMGAALVDGRVSPDRFLVSNKDEAIVERHIADKRVMVPHGLESGTATRLVGVSRERRRMPSLDDAGVREVSRMARAAAESFGSPQDIEWARADGQLYLLQSRPITTLAAEPVEAPPDGRYVIFKPLLENFSEPFTPLTADICRRLFPPGYVIHRGRTYIALSEIRRVIPWRASDRQVAQIGYLGSLDAVDKPLRLSPLRLVLQAVGLVLLYLVYGVFLGRTARLPDDAMAPYRKRVESLLEDGRLPPLEMAWAMGGAGAGFFAPVGLLPVSINISAARYWLWLGAVNALLGRWCPGSPRETGSLLCAGTSGVKSTDMGRAIVALAALARRSVPVAAVFADLPNDEVLDRLTGMPAAREFLGGFEAFLDEHGHRAIKEFELGAPRWREEPATVIAMIRNHLGANNDAAGMEGAAVRRRDSLRRRIRAQLAPHGVRGLAGWRWRVLRYCIGRTKYFTKLRENSRYYHIMIMGALRERIVRIERRLMQRGSLRCAGDVFYLEYGELMALDAGRIDWSDVEQNIRDRRLAWVRESKRRPARTLGIEHGELIPVAPTGDGRLLRGAGASPGHYVGRARVIRDPAADAELQAGEILVAPYTDPAWTPLFLSARAAVVEIGSYLSHAGTIAREYGMPCVVDVENATALITTGSRIAVDGVNGTVTLLDEPGDEEAVRAHD